MDTIPKSISMMWNANRLVQKPLALFPIYCAYLQSWHENMRVEVKSSRNQIKEISKKKKKLVIEEIWILLQNNLNSKDNLSPLSFKLLTNLLNPFITYRMWHGQFLSRVKLRINFYLLRTFCPHLGSFFCVVSSFTTFRPNFTSGLLQVILPWPRIGMMSFVTVFPVITAFHSGAIDNNYGRQ